MKEDLSFNSRNFFFPPLIAVTHICELLIQAVTQRSRIIKYSLELIKLKSNIEGPSCSRNSEKVSYAFCRLSFMQ